jgi:hypothetical protein
MRAKSYNGHKQASKRHLFLSHSTDDAALVDAFNRLMKDGAGLTTRQFFCSSSNSNISNGTLFVDTILQRLSDASVVVCLLSPAYFNSQFCIAEMGAGRVLNKKFPGTFYSLVIPPFTFPDVDKGMLHGVQTGHINDYKELDSLKERVDEQIDLASEGLASTPEAWDKAKRAFINAITNDMLLRKIILQDLYFERDDHNATIHYKSKLRVVFTNTTGHKIQIEEPIWNGTNIETKEKPKPFKSPIQIERSIGSWKRDQWQPEPVNQPFPVEIAQDTTFRTWIGLHEEKRPFELRTLHSTLAVGTLSIPITIDGRTIGTIDKRI